jgi:sarcosine oxidase subunit gamma
MADASTPSIRVAEVPFLTQLTVRVGPKSAAFDQAGAVLGFGLPIEPNTVAGDRHGRALWLGPDEWLIVAADRSDLEPALSAALNFGAVVDVSAQRTTIELAGPAARELLAKGCSVDLHQRAFGVGQCAQTTFARAPVILLPRAADAYWVLVRASFAEYFAEFVLDAMTEYRTIGPRDS